MQRAVIQKQDEATKPREELPPRRCAQDPLTKCYIPFENVTKYRNSEWPDRLGTEITVLACVNPIALGWDTPLKRWHSADAPLFW